MDNQALADALIDVANIKKAKGANKFSIGSYKKASLLISNLATPASTLDFENTKGIGPKIAASIKEFLITGKIQFVEDNRSLLQSTIKIDELLKVEGIGEKTALKIYQTLNITTIGQLKKAVEDGTISQLFKEKTIANIKKGLEYLELSKGRIRLDQGLELAITIYGYIKPYVKRIEACGSLRRSRETIGDLDIAVIAKDNVNVLEKFATMPIVSKVIDSNIEDEEDRKKVSVWINGVRVDCYVFTEDVFESGVMHLTGSADHNTRLREIAKWKGWILSQYGIYKAKVVDGKRVRTGPRLDDGTERGIYKLLGFEFIPPEHRDDVQKFDKYRLGNNVELLKVDDIQFDYHVHTTWSDGVSTIEDVVQFAKSQGLKGIAICDHSQSLKIAKGLSVEKLLEKNKEIDVLRRKYPDFHILKGSEVDIKSDGTLDYPDDVLDTLDVVVASIHFHSTNDVTEVYKAAIRSGRVHIIGHIVGRYINDRKGHEFNIEEILQECKLHNVAIELNCQPNRLDANENILKRCKELGVKVALGSDAHEKNQIKYVRSYGLWIGKRAWLTQQDLY